MLDPQVIVNLLQQRGQQSALRTGRVGCRNVGSSVSHKALTSTTVSMYALNPKSDAAVTFRRVTLTANCPRRAPGHLWKHLSAYSRTREEAERGPAVSKFLMTVLRYTDSG